MDPSRLLYTAVTDDKKEFCVKITRSYSADAHSTCAALGFAPQLLGFERVAGGWFLVAMAKVDGEYVDLSQPTPAIRTEVEEKVRLLHGAGFVHGGDIRDTNIMVIKDGTPGFMLVDFDWSGICGIARYPTNVNRGPHLWRPDGARDGALITTAHDMEMLDHLFK